MNARREARIDSVPEPRDPLLEATRTMSRSPGSSVAMCHEQGKTAVYLSKDGAHIIHHAPDGTIRKTALKRAATR